MLDKIPAIMIDPAVVIDTRCDPAGLKVVFSDGTSKVLTCVGGGGGPTPTATIKVNGGQTANVTPSSDLSVRVQGVAAGTSIQWAGTGTSVSDPLIASLTSLAGSSSSTDFTVNVPVGTAQRVITFTASVSGTQVAAFTVTVAATATDFQLSATPSLSFASGSTVGQQASISLTNLVGNPGSVSVTVSAGSAPVSVSPTSLSLSQSTTSGTVTVTPTAGAASGTYSITVTATNGTTTRTATISVSIAAVAYSAPTLQILTEPGLPANEMSLGSRFGLRITNVYPGSGARLVLKGWNAGPSQPSGTDLDISVALTDPMFASFYDATTKVLEWPVASGFLVELGWLSTTEALRTASGQPNVTISSGTMPLRAAVTAPDGVERISPQVNVMVKAPVQWLGPVNSNQTGWDIRAGVAGTMQFNMYVPKLAGQKVGFFWSTDGFKHAIELGTLSSNGILNFSFPYPDTFADQCYTWQGSTGEIEVQTYTGADTAAVKTALLGRIYANYNPVGGPADVAPNIVFGKRNGASPIEFRWYNGSTPVSTLASQGYYGASNDPNVWADQGMTVPRSALGNTLSLQIKNLLMVSQSGQAQYFVTGISFSGDPSFNHLTAVGNSSSGQIHWGTSKVTYAGADVTINLPMNVVDAFFAQLLAVKTAFIVYIGAYDPVMTALGTQYYYFRGTSLTITN